MSNKTYEKKGSIKNGIKRLIFVVLSFFIETGIIVLLFTELANYAEVLNLIIRLLGLGIVLYMYSESKTSSMKMPWIILILAFPIFGTGIYLTIGLNATTRLMRRHFDAIDNVVLPYLHDDKAIMDELKAEDNDAYSISKYLSSCARYPVYKNTGIEFINEAYKGLDMQLKDMEQATSYIFMEYFAIANDESWKRVEDVLIKKVKEGVEVRVFYDDVGSIGFINLDFVKRLEHLGIKCKVFNPCTAGLKLILNHRDHRKITIIDGRIAYTGGYNIANEYFGVTCPYGRWKDTGVRIEGPAVKNLLVTFLGMWLFERGRKPINLDPVNDVEPYLPSDNAYTDVSTHNGYVQPYADTPLDDENVGEEVYISIINKANDYCYFVTPYLIITDEMLHAFILAAKRGVDVRIITPGIPDKKLVYSVTRSYYHALTKGGVRIYEWTPGFCHAKMCASDDSIATCGTINLDYRSLYHHFEDGCLIIGCDMVNDVKNELMLMMNEGAEVTESYRNGRSSILKLGQLFLRLFAELI